MRVFSLRDIRTDKVTFSKAIADGYEFFFLELPELFEGKANVRRKTCIPCGVYPLRLALSHRAGHDVPWLSGVPDRDAVQIHPANYTRDLLGCLGPGETRDVDQMMVRQSRVAFDRLYAILEAAVQRGESIDIEIRNA